MKLSLVSDFKDFYDDCFDSEGDVFTRNKSSNLTKPEIFQYLKSCLKLNVPVHGICNEMHRYFDNDNLVIVYSSFDKTKIDGRHLVKFSDAIKFHPDKFIVEYLKGSMPSFVTKSFSIGKRMWTVTCKSDDYWRSNVGNVQMNVESEVFDQTRVPSKMPLFCIDFIRDFDTYYAIDFDCSPTLNGSGLEQMLEPEIVVELIREKYFKCKP
jgi:hypothetical protein